MFKIPDFDPEKQEHYWCYSVVFKAEPNDPFVHLNRERLVSMSGPCCYYCIELYSPLRAQVKCKGVKE